MSISALTSEAARLLQVFQTKESSINAQVAAAVAAVPTMTKTYYVDAVAGNDSNAGTSAAPWLTLNKALTTINGLSGHDITIYLAPNDPASVYEFNRDVKLSNSIIALRMTGSGSIKPVIRMGYRNTVYNGQPTKYTYGFIGGANLEVYIVNCTIESPTVPPEDAGNNLHPDQGLVQRSEGGKVRIISCNIVMKDLVLLMMTGTVNAVRFGSCTVTSVSGTAMVKIAQPIILSVAGTVITTEGVTLPQLITNRLYSTSGYPLNFVSDYDFAGA
jgi:hypothetical protein